MKPAYSTPISIAEARQFVRMYISDRASIPHGSKALWVAGCKWVTDQPGCYLIAGVGGMQGVIVTPPAKAMEQKAS